MDVHKRAAEYIKKIWGNLSLARKVVLGAALAVLLPLLYWAVSASTVNGMVKAAGAEMRQDERAQVVKKLQEKNQAFEIRGGEVYLPAADAERVMFELNAEGVLSEDAIWKNVLEPNLLATGKDKEKMFQIALQRKLERMIRSIRGVLNAAVQVTLQAETDHFFKDAPKASASVQLELEAGRVLRQENVDAIAGLVARAVTGLNPDRVHIMDTSGRAYRVRKADGRAQSAADIRDIEIQYEDQVKAGIAHLLPEARVVVRVQAESRETHSEDITHSKPVTVFLKERRVGEPGAAAAGASGIKGGGPAEPAVEAVPSKPPFERETEEQNVVGQRKETVHAPAGAVEKITVGVLIPVREADLERERQKEADYKKLIMMAAGPKADEKSVSLMFVPTRPPAPLPPPDFWDDAREFLSTPAASTAGIGLLVLAVLGILYAVLRKAMPGISVEDLPPRPAGLPGEAVLLPAPGVPLGEEEVARVRMGLREMVARNPRSVSAILRRWLAGK